MNKDGLKKLIRKIESLPDEETEKTKNLNKKSTQIAVYISKNYDDFLENFAIKRNTSKSALIDYAIDLFIESYGRIFNER